MTWDVDQKKLKALYKKLGTANVNKALAYQFENIGVNAVAVARNDGSYKDQTGVLRSSISYSVFNNGKVSNVGDYKTYKANVRTKKGQRSARMAKARKNAAKYLKSSKGKGVELRVAAGADYAYYVENVRGKIVLSTAKEYAKQEVKKSILNLYKLNVENE